MSKLIREQASYGLFIVLALMATAAGAQEPKTWQELGLMRGFPPAADKRVTLENWMSPPFNRYGFQHVRQLMPTSPFVRHRGQSVPLVQSSTAALANLNVKGLNGRERLLDDFLKQTYTDGFLVLHHGQIVYERYFNGMTEATPHLLFSVTKSFTGTLVGMLHERGQIDYTHTVRNYIPELAQSGFGDATIRQMMDMQVGVGWDETPDAFADPESLVNQYAKAGGFAPSKERMTPYTFLPKMSKSNEHGTRFQYVAPVTDVLGWLLERVSGKSYPQLLDEEIISQLRIEGDGFMVVDSWGKGLSTGGLNLTTRDLARFGVMLQQGGRLHGRRIASEHFIEDSRFNGDKAAFARGAKDSDWLAGGSYRNQFWVTSGESPALICSGVFGQFLYVAPEAEVVIARVASHPGSITDIDNVMPGLFEQIKQQLSQMEIR